MKVKKEIIDFFFNEQELRVFAYGSLMWRPDFEFESLCKAYIQGYKRFWGIPSIKYRGTSQFHGLVLALKEIEQDFLSDNNQSSANVNLVGKGEEIKDALASREACQGLLYRIADTNDIVVICDKLWNREMMNDVYMPKVTDVYCHDSQKFEKALTFTVNYSHPNYIANIDDSQAIQRICTASGLSGSNIEYFINAGKMFKKFDIKDANFENFLSKLKKHHEKTKHKI